MLESGPDPALDLAGYERWRERIELGLAEQPYPLPVKTIPPHHSQVHLAGAGDIAEIFGEQDKAQNFVIGHTREQGHPVCIDLDKFIQRSSGIFGATGTGKSFLTRIILAGLMKRNEASLLVLDMHNEYGYDDVASDTRQKVIGLRSKFPARVRVVGLGKGAQIRNQVPDFNLEIAESDISPVDIELLTRELNLKETTPTTLEALVATFGQQNWFSEFRKMRTGAMIEDQSGKRVPAPGSVAHDRSAAAAAVAGSDLRGAAAVLVRQCAFPRRADVRCARSCRAPGANCIRDGFPVCQPARHRAGCGYLPVRIPF